jgi:hypothetical protein
MTRFEEALLTELTARVDRQTSRPPRSHRRPILVAAGVGAAAAVTAGLLLAPGGQTPAYALERAADGTYRLAVHQVAGIDAANQALAEEGIRARVYRLGDPGSCPEFRLGDRPDVPSRLTDHGGTDENWFYFPREIPQDVTLVLTVSTIDSGPDTLVVSSSAIRGDAPPCVEDRTSAPAPDGTDEPGPPAGARPRK